MNLLVDKSEVHCQYCADIYPVAQRLALAEPSSIFPSMYQAMSGSYVDVPVVNIEYSLGGCELIWLPSFKKKFTLTWWLKVNTQQERLCPCLVICGIVGKA